MTSNQSEPQKGNWGHIFFPLDDRACDSTSANAIFDESGNYEAGSILQHAVIEYGGGISSDSLNGAIIAENATPFIDHVTIRHNKEAAIRVRGGLLYSNEDIKITNNLIRSNGDGHCIADIDNLATTTVTNNTVISNTGNGKCVSFGNSLINQNIVQKNVGRGIAIGASDTVVSSNTVMSNTLGGISHADAYAAITHNTIYANQGTKGAGLKVTSLGADSREVLIYANTILSNTASSSGGGLYLGCTLYPYDVRENIITGNRVLDKEGYGGGVMLVFPCEKANFSFNDIYDNQATYGHALYNATGKIDARLNYWGTQNSSEIEEAIYHQLDSQSFGFVDYTSYLSKPISELPRLYLPVTTR